MSAVNVLARDMTDDERIAWGRQEADCRKVDLTVRSAAGLAAAQANAEARRKSIGASRLWASSAVSDALRLARIGAAA